MKNEDKIVELLSEKLQKFDILDDRFSGLNNRFDSMNDKFDVLNDKVENLNKTFNKRLGSVEKEIVKLNLISAQNSRSLLKLGDNSDRIKRLEKAVFK